MGRRTGIVAVALLAVGLCCVTHGVAASSTGLGRKLSSTCTVDNCGIWCGPPRPPPCGNAMPSLPPPCYGSSGTTQSGSWGLNSNNENCKCNHGSWGSCQPKQCYGDNGQPYNENKWGMVGGQECKCKSGSWQQCKQQPQPCFSNGASYNENSWAVVGNQECKCKSGSWQQCKPMTPSQPEKGCIGGLPFGLENCVCDGAEIGSVAGLAACGRVATECLPPVAAFSVGQNTLEAVQQVCDTLSMDACISSAQQAPVINNGCGDLLRFGTGLCSPEQAMEVFMNSVNLSCDPLCKDC